MLFKFKNSRTKTKAKLLTLGALLFSFGVATSAVATSAWYNLIDIAVVNNLNLKINMKEDAWIKLNLLDDDKNPVERLEGNDGYTSEQLGIIEDKTLLRDVSGMYQSNWDKPGFDPSNEFPTFRTRYFPGSTSKQNTGDESIEKRNETYVQNRFEIKAGLDTDIYLDPETSIEAATELNAETAKKEGWDSNREAALNKAAHAVRISFLVDESTEDEQKWNYYIVNDGTTSETYYGDVLDLNNDGYYDNDGTSEYLYGEFLDKDYQPTYLDEPEANKITLEQAKNNNNTFEACHQDGIKQVDRISAYKNIKKENALPIDSMTFDVNNPLKPTTPICHVKAGQTKHIVISIYVEGWDRYMTDDIASAKFNVNISFTGLVKD